MVRSPVRCGGIYRTGNNKGKRCKTKGEPNEGSSFYCSHHLICKGIVLSGDRCGSRAKYDGYCGAAHLPGYQAVGPWKFRGDTSNVREEIIQKYKDRDAYTRLKMQRIEIDHIMEGQVWAHVFNEVHKRGHANDKCELDDIRAEVANVKKLSNDTKNLAPVSRDINRLKGAGIKTFLDERTFRGRSANFTSCLSQAHHNVDKTELDDKGATLDDTVVKTIKGKICRRLKWFRKKLKTAAANCPTKLLIVKEMKRLAAQIEGDDDEDLMSAKFEELHV